MVSLSIKRDGVNSNSRIISTDEDPSLRIESFAIIINKFTWCFHKAKQVHCIHHANVQGTY